MPTRWRQPTGNCSSRAGGGALGLFTAIARLRAAHERLAEPLDDTGLPLLAQHVDGFDVATLVDLFRAERNACLLGTDAVRDGIDVPGRRAAPDRVRPGCPGPRPDRLHRARGANASAARPGTTCRRG